MQDLRVDAISVAMWPELHSAGGWPPQSCTISTHFHLLGAPFLVGSLTKQASRKMRVDLMTLDNPLSLTDLVSSSVEMEKYNTYFRVLSIE